MKRRRIALATALVGAASALIAAPAAAQPATPLSPKQAAQVSHTLNRPALLTHNRLLAGLQRARAAAPAAAPSTTPTNVTATPTSGDITFGADSTAPKVAFQVDADPAMTPVAVATGHATQIWPSWGYADGSHTLTAYDCDLTDACNSTGTAVSFTVDNVDPVVTFPTSGASITGGFTITATAPDGVGLRFLIDGNRVGFVNAAPYQLAYTGSELSQGAHTVQVVECSTDEAHCAGPASPAVSFTSNSLHPVITSLTPNPFSPNGDGVKETTRAGFQLPSAQSVVIRVTNAGGTTVRGPYSLGTLSGSHFWTWNGRTNSGARAADGTYTVKLHTAAVVNGVTVHGDVSRTVRLDTVAPIMSHLTGAGSTFYPYPDGYRDTFRPAFNLSENGRVTLVIKTTSGRTIRSISASLAKGRVAISWNGHDASGHTVSAGTYRFLLVATDAASNTRKTQQYSVVVSAKRLVHKSATITRNGVNFSSVGGGPDPSCLGYSKSLSDFAPYGVWLDNTCASGGSSLIAAFYHFQLPSAIKYGSLTFQTYGFADSFSLPTEISGGFMRAADGGFDVPKFLKVTSSSKKWYTLGTVPAAGHYNSKHVSTVGLGVDDFYGTGSFDIRYTRLVVTYAVLG